MEDVTKEDPAHSKEPKFLGKAGWVKKSTGKLLASYKDLYIHVEKTEIVVYENEDLQNCLERWDLENYDKCLELRSMFKKKNRLVLIRAPRSGNKVKVGDSNLEHVTRSRPKGNRNRRPPTRIHMKEVACVSSDGILRLDLDFASATMPNGTHRINADAGETPEEDMKQPTPPPDPSITLEEQWSALNTKEEPETVTELSPQKKVPQPPMLPSKEAKPATPPDRDPCREDPEKVLPPSEEEMSSILSAEVSTNGSSSEAISEKILKGKNETGPPPILPNKPTRSPTDQYLEASQTRLETGPPTPPSKNKKPSQSAVESKQEVVPSKLCDTVDENKQSEGEDEKKEEVPDAVNEMELSPLISNEALPGVREPMITDPTKSTDAGYPKVHEPHESASTVTDNTSNEPQKSLEFTPSAPTPELLRKSPGAPPSLKKKPVKCLPPKTAVENMTIITQPQEKPDHTTSLQMTSDSSVSSPCGNQALDHPMESGNNSPAMGLSLNDPADVATTTCPQSYHLDVEKKKREEEKSVDSGRHSGEDSEGSENVDMLATSTAAIRGSHASLDVLNIGEADTMKIDTLGQVVDEEPQAMTKAAGLIGQSTSIQTRPNIDSRPTVPLKPSAKVRSASTSDLLSDTSGRTQIKHPSEVIALNDGAAAHHNDTTSLEREVTLELESTSKLLSLVSQTQREEGFGGGQGEDKPEDLLTKAMEKLKMADHFLREVINLKELKNMKNTCKRNSW
ncbi:uncharacterized protein plekho2 isoform X2 [Lampris incognitus]|uniref:uncharacterized protein plekho2 isoform X2 n=1 Tax=Lampris incognitus TaxID=2546036 RepID=UPI0024B4DD18|nr:uncharacterized protein plekho2 isoform X2 [Lampris incognitus]